MPGQDASHDGVVGEVRRRLAAFVAEREPWALPLALDAFDEAAATLPAPVPDDPAQRRRETVERLRSVLEERLRARMAERRGALRELDGLETTPRVGLPARLEHAAVGFIEACDACLARLALEWSFTREERRELLRGMLLTRATDNRLKTFFTSSEVRYGAAAFQGKGFRSLGQEAIYAAGLRLRRSARWRDSDGTWLGDIVAPVIRDLGIALAMHPDAEGVRLVLAAQMGKADSPMRGRDLHIGDFAWGVLPPAAPLAISSLTVAGLAFAFAMRGEARVALSFIGEGGASLGEWHEAINTCAAHRLPAVFCVENNQTALSTPVAEQSAARVFADKAAGYGIPGVTIDGTDPDRIAAAFAWAASRAREGHGPTLIELVSLRMCGHAHHDDMLYLGKDAPGSWTYPRVAGSGYVDADAYEFWRARDPIACYAARLADEGVVETGEVEAWKREIAALVEEAAALVVAAPWPERDEGRGEVFTGLAASPRVECLAPDTRLAASLTSALPALEANEPFVKDGRTFLEAITLGIRDALVADPRVFVYGEDVGGRYGNAFMLLRPLLDEFGRRIVNSTLAEGAVVGVAVGAALAGLRPIAEMQFNDFVASGFNQVVNNAAKTRYRWGASVPMVLRMPWGGLRHAGPYHSQNTEAWFYRTPGLKIVVPSTPADARRLLASAVADPDPVLYYEHIALYRDPRVRQALDDAAPGPLPVGRAALRRAGADVAIITYGAYVHHALRVASRLAGEGIEASVLDLRWLAPLDREAILAVARHTSRVVIVHEDTRTGGIGESVAAFIQEAAFESLDAPICILGALDTPVPYSPPLEEAFLVSEEEIERAVRQSVRY
jgi:2-oxoisovalerate dehydrogenase E1 component